MDKRFNENLEGDAYNPNDETTRGAARVAPARDMMMGTADVFQGGYSKGNQLKGVQSFDFKPIAEQKTRAESSDLQPVSRTVSEIRSRGGAVWEARPRPETSDFYYRSTALHFGKQESLAQLVEQVYQFCDREYTVEIQKVNPAKGTFNLAVFVKEALVIVKLRFWRDPTDTFVMEIEMRDGEPLAFGMVYRKLREYLQPTEGLNINDVRDKVDDLDLSIDVLMEQGMDFPAPAPEEWELILEECEVSPQSEVANSANVASSVEALSSIAQTYEAEDLEFLCKTIVEKKIGFIHSNYAVEKQNSTYQQLWAMSALLNHLARTPTNAEHLKDLLPTLDITIRHVINNSDVWFSVVNALCFTYLSIVKTCSESNIPIPEQLKELEKISIPSDYAQKHNTGMVEESKLISKSADAQKHLAEAYNLMVTA